MRQCAGVRPRPSASLCGCRGSVPTPVGNSFRRLKAGELVRHVLHDSPVPAYSSLMMTYIHLYVAEVESVYLVMMQITDYICKCV